MSTIKTSKTTTKRRLTPYEVVDHCPKCVDQGVDLEKCELKLDDFVACYPPAYRVSCPNCGHHEVRRQRPRRIEYEKGEFIT